MTLTWFGLFAAGLATFLSPCVLPIVPIVAANYIMAKGESRFTRVHATSLFSLGFLLTFTLMGLSLPFVTDFLGESKVYLLILSGIIILLYGFKMSGTFNNSEGSNFFSPITSRMSSWMSRSAYLPNFEKYFPKSFHGFIFGATFGLAWTPCVGPILGGVLAYVATKDRSLFESALMMFTFGTGVVAPFIGLAFGGELVSKRLDSLKKHLPKIEQATGYGLIVLGVFILTQSNIPRIFTANPTSTEITFVTSNNERFTLSDPKLAPHKLFFFHTESCPYCQAMEAYLPSVEADCKASTVQILRVDINQPENQRIAEHFSVRSVPTVSLVSPEGYELAHSVGYQSETKLRQGLSMIPQSFCMNSTAPQDTAPFLSPQYEEGQSCGGSGNGLTC